MEWRVLLIVQCRGMSDLVVTRLTVCYLIFELIKHRQQIAINFHKDCTRLGSDRYRQMHRKIRHLTHHSQPPHRTANPASHSQSQQTEKQNSTTSTTSRQTLPVVLQPLPGPTSLLDDFPAPALDAAVAVAHWVVSHRPGSGNDWAVSAHSSRVADDQVSD